MTQEEKQLLLKDLCARLPYGVRVKELEPILKPIKELEFYLTSIYHDNVQVETMTGGIIACSIEAIKPYLRPMSSMTEGEEKEIEETLQYTQYTLESYDWLNSHHFDYRNLIEKGLALEAPEGIYKVVKKSNALFEKCLANVDPAIRKEVSDNIDKVFGRQPVTDCHNLEEELENYAKLYPFEDAGSYRNLITLARHFAEWQRKQDQGLIELAEDHAMLARMNKMKEQMMEKAVGGRYMKADGKAYVESWPLEIDTDSVKAGDEVRLIVIPEKSEKVK